MDVSDLTNRFSFHPAKEDQPAKYEKIRAKALEFALLINELVPDSREKSVSVTALDDVVYNANAGIARHS